MTDRHNLFTIHCDSIYHNDYPDGIKKTVNVDVSHLEIDLSATPNPVSFNQRTKIQWNIKNAKHCYIPIDKKRNNLPGFFGRIRYEHNVNYRWFSPPLIAPGQEYTITIECLDHSNNILYESLIIKTKDNPWFEET